MTKTLEIPDKIFYRLLLSYEPEIIRKFYWFLMKKDDLYWGSSYKGAFSTDFNPQKKDNQITITIPENFDQLPKFFGKYSYHESGYGHYKSQTSKNTDQLQDSFKWKSKNEIIKPTRFFALISKSLKYYNKIYHAPTKGKDYKGTIHFQGLSPLHRIYFEFYLTPPGKYNFPNDFEEPFIDIPGFFNNYITHSLSQKLILIIRFEVITNLDWKNHVELLFQPTELS